MKVFQRFEGQSSDTLSELRCSGHHSGESTFEDGFCDVR